MTFIVTLFAALVCPALAMAAPATGDAYVYRVIDGYNQETVGHVRHEVTEATPAQTRVAVSPDARALGVARSDILTPDGQWLRGSLDSHGMGVVYELTSALPVVPSALTPGHQWSVRMNAKVPSENLMRSVRVDAEVLRAERVRVPAGAFDTILIRRTLYVGDAGDFTSETQVSEMDWYAPALGRSVRTETRSNWRQTSGCRRSLCNFRGDWHVHELIEARMAPR